MEASLHRLSGSGLILAFCMFTNSSFINFYKLISLFNYKLKIKLRYPIDEYNR